MKLITIIRNHGQPALMENPNNGTVVRTDTQDDLVNQVWAKYPDAMITVETIYSEQTGTLMDAIYIQVSDTGNDNNDDDSDDDDDDYDDMNPLSTAFLKGLLKNK